jgi:BASS family bile acid:Na+ symporter
MIIDIFLPVSLAFIMFTLGLGLTADDFRNVLRNPKAFAVGMVNQMLVLPAVAFGLIRLFNLQGEMAVGLMILSCCPGGVTSNIITKIAKGDTALSISYTAVVSILTMITLPIIAGFSVVYFMGAQAPPVSVLSLGLIMLLLATIPVIIGLIIHNKATSFTRRFEPMASRISSVLFVFIVIGALASEWQLFVDNVLILGPMLVVLILTMLIIGYTSARIFKIRESQASSVAIATGIQNVTMGITIGNIIMPVRDGLSVFALPSGVYGIIMYLVCLPVVFLYVRWLKKKVPAILPTE